jgi:hypothetical protein
MYNLTKIETLIKCPSTKKTPPPNGFTEKFYQTIKAELTQNFHKIGKE